MLFRSYSSEYYNAFIEFCEANEVSHVDDCEESERACRTSVGVQTDEIENCNGDPECEIGFASVHIDDCDRYENVGLNSACLFSRSYIESDRKYCDQIEELSAFDCDWTSEEADFYECYLNRGKCLWGLADRKLDAEMCGTIQGFVEADLCKFSMAVRLSDSTFCEELDSTFFPKKFCVEIVNSGGIHPAFEEGILNYKDTRPE